MAVRVSTQYELEVLLARMEAEAWPDVRILTAMADRSGGDERAGRFGRSAEHVVVLNCEIVGSALWLWARVPPSVNMLAVPGCAIGEAGARAIAEHLPGLISLDLSENQIGEAGARAIAEHLRGLSSLNLAGNDIGDVGAQAIAAHVSGLVSLNLTSNQIVEAGARAIAEHLSGLDSLNLWHNQIGDAGARAIAEHLHGLASLGLGRNQIGEAGARAIAENLQSLTALNLWNNQIGEAGARAIAENLKGLTALNLWNNQIGEAGARAIAENLRGLTSLGLGRNQIGETGARVVAEHLRGLISLRLEENAIAAFSAGTGLAPMLETLDLSHNHLTRLQIEPGALAHLRRLGLEGNRLRTLPEGLTDLEGIEWLDVRGNRLERLPRELARCERLRWLSVRGNETLKVLPELLEDEPVRFPHNPGEPNAARILRWLARQAGGKRRLNEAKVLLVGQGGVGKTSLVRYVVDGLKCDPGETRTDGILISEWKEVTNAEHAEENIKLNIWDFGGQEIMHATHQFFLTKRSLYLLVLDARKGEQEGNLHYWLGLLRGLGGDAPVIVVTNQCDGGNDLKLNETRLRLDYPNIRAFVKTSCETGDGIDELRRRIAHEVNGLPNAKEEWPEAYFLIKQELAERAKQAHHVGLEEYQGICTRHDVTGTDEQTSVLRFLHDLGVVLYYDDPKLACDARLHDKMILDPGWVTDGVYRVVTSTELQQAKGVLEVGKLAGIMEQSKSPYRYDAEGRHYILGMMEKFELCFEYPGHDHRRYLVPERLDEYEPTTLDWERADALRFQVSYAVLPGGVIPRLITRTATMHKADPAPWRSGVVLCLEGCEAYVRGDRQKNRIFVHVHGERNARRRALAVIRYQLRDINATLPGIRTEELVPLPEEPEVTVKYTYLLQLEQDGDEQFRPEGAKRRYRVRELLEGVGVLEERPMQAGFVDPSRIADAVIQHLQPQLDEVRSERGSRENELTEQDKRRLQTLRDWLTTGLKGAYGAGQEQLLLTTFCETARLSGRAYGQRVCYRLIVVLAIADGETCTPRPEQKRIRDLMSRYRQAAEALWPALAESKKQKCVPTVEAIRLAYADAYRQIHRDEIRPAKPASTILRSERDLPRT
jgi:internalin A